MTASFSAGDSAPLVSRVFLGTLLSLALLLAWDHSGLDLWMAHWFGSAAGFAYEDHWFWRGTLHDDIRWLPWGVELALLAAVARPFGALRQLAVERRVQLALTTLASLLVVSTLKLHSLTSCPWELHEFGGTVAYVSHWAWGVHDGGSGGAFRRPCLGGFCVSGRFFAFRHALPRTAQRRPVQIFSMLVPPGLSAPMGSPQVMA
jgi:membrane-associated PAP2 superfamily phosphatase